MKQIKLLSLVAMLAMSASPAVAQGSAASGAMMSSTDCSKAARQRHDHAAEGGRGTPRTQAQSCPPVTSASAAAAKAAKKKSSHDHPGTK